MQALRRSIFVVAGIGDGSGTGAAAARLFAKSGYRIAIIARQSDHLQKTAAGINAEGGEAAAFPVKAYSYGDIHAAFNAIKNQWKDSDIRVGVFNAGAGVWKGFLDITEEDVKNTVDVNVLAGFAFARECILAFKDLPLDKGQKKGTLIFTGATASIRGNKTTSAFAAGKHALRALSQSLNKEFGSQDIHVAHAIIDGGILTNRSKENKSAEWRQDAAAHLEPDSIAKSYLYLANQDRSAWTWELDLRPAHESW